MPSSVREEIRSQKRELSRENRSLQRQMLNSKREEEKIQAEMKAAAKRGDTSSVKMLAKQLIQHRKQGERMRHMSGTLKAMEFKVSQQGAQATMANAMKSVGSVISSMNEKVNPRELQDILMQFSRENEKMDMKEDMLDSAMDDLFDDGDMDEEMDEALEAIFDEIGLETKSKLGGVQVGSSKLHSTKAKEDQAEDLDEEDEDLVKRLNKLKG